MLIKLMLVSYVLISNDLLILGSDLKYVSMLCNTYSPIYVYVHHLMKVYHAKLNVSKRALVLSFYSVVWCLGNDNEQSYMVTLH